MNERFQFNCAYILVLWMLLHSIVSHCRSELVKDTSGYISDEQRGKLDPFIEQIFRGPSDRRNDAIDPKRNLDSETDKGPVRSEESDKHVRVKRENAVKKSSPKSLNEGAKNEEKRSTRTSKSSTRAARSSRDLPRLADKESNDYEVSADQERSEYSDEAEDEPDSKSKETKYKGGEFRVGEDSDRFIDQEERSSLYDDFEAKDVVKRGISGAEDYEEFDEEGVEVAEDAALDESLDEEADKRKVRGDARVKRERSKQTENVAGKTDDAGASGDTSNDAKSAVASLKRDAGSDRDGKAIESQASKGDKESSSLEQSKRNVAEKSDDSKVSHDREADTARQTLTANDQTEIESSENAKVANQETREATGDRKTQEEVGLSDNKASNGLTGESSSLKGSSKTDDTKVADAATNYEATKVEVPANVAETSASEDAAKMDASRNEAAMKEQEGDYEKRVEEQIQRKIDSIKEEIKREIAEKQRIREIEENNAKFDELREQGDDDDEEQSESEPSEKRENPSKRSVRNPGKSRARESAEKRSTKRKKRQNEIGEEKVQSSASVSKKSSREGTRKRSTRAELASSLKEAPIKKRDNPREVFLVRSERNTGKKKRRRRSKNPMLIPEQRTVKLVDNLPADFTLDSSLRGDLGDGKQSSSSSSKATEDERTIAEQDSLTEKKAGSVASLTGSNEELGPLANEYGEAFGGLHGGEPGVALARFKRIKRVLRPPSSKT